MCTTLYFMVAIQQVAQLKAKLTEERAVKRAVGEARLAQQSAQHTKKLAEERAEVCMSGQPLLYIGDAQQSAQHTKKHSN